MKKDLAFFGQLFSATFSLSAFTFGGGFVIIPLMRKKFVEKMHWLDDDEMLDLMAIAQSSPGAIAVNAAILTGYRLAGIPGALVSLLGTVLPPLITLSIISLFYNQFQGSLIVSRVPRGMQAGVVAVVADVVFMLSRDIIRKREVIPIIVMSLAFVAASVFKMNVILIILTCGIIGAARTIRNNRRQEMGKPS